MEKKPGQIITFYSYKGGTGRSMCLANVAYLLTHKNSNPAKKTLLIDWDLEAPGLHRYFYQHFQSELSFNHENTEYEDSLAKRKGLIDFLWEAKKYYENTFPSEEFPDGCSLQEESITAFKQLMDKIPLSEYILKVDNLQGLYLMKSGAMLTEANGQSYSSKVRQFEWEKFYMRYGSFFFHLKDFLMNEYEFVLIDSRTGITDTSGICTRLMPEKLVTVFVPNRQNIDGVKLVIEETISYRENSRDIRGLTIFPLASRVDSLSSKLRDIWWHGGKIDDEEIIGYQTIFENLFKRLYGLDNCDLSNYFSDTQINYDSDYAFGEKIAARKGTTDRLSIGFACNNLTDILLASSTPWTLGLDRSEAKISIGNRTDSAKRIIVCCDGVWNSPPNSNERGQPVRTNVQKIFDLIQKRDDRDKLQAKFYGVGIEAGSLLHRIFNSVSGKGIDESILDAYKFVVWNYEEGSNWHDEIYLFGFSRGAYIVRSLSGLIRKCGIVKKNNLNEVMKAYEFYRNKEIHPESETAKEFRQQFSYENPRIKFIGVWDTVGSLGIPVNFFQWINKRKYSFYDTTLSSIVENAYHAISVDEKRANFKPALWEKSLNTTSREFEQVLEQRWFAGDHSNVGGGYPDEGLSDITLQWMIEKASICGLQFDNDRLAFDLRPNIKGTLYGFKSGVSPNYTRSITTGTIDSSVYERIKLLPLYRPSNVFQENYKEKIDG